MLIAKNNKTKEIFLFPEYRLSWISLWEEYELLGHMRMPKGIKARFKDNFGLRDLIEWNRKRMDNFENRIEKLKEVELMLKKILEKHED